MRSIGNPTRQCQGARSEAADERAQTQLLQQEIILKNALSRIGVLSPEVASAHVILTAREALRVPSSALVRTGEKMEIYIVADPVGDPAKGTVKRLEVQTGFDAGLRVEIKADNVTGRELVIAKGAGVLRAGDQVIAVPVKTTD